MVYNISQYVAISIIIFAKKEGVSINEAAQSAMITHNRVGGYDEIWPHF